MQIEKAANGTYLTIKFVDGALQCTGNYQESAGLCGRPRCVGTTSC